MADDRVKGIVVEIGGDTSALSKSLGDVNKNINNTQKQLKDVERLLKLDPTNTNLLAQKQRLLAEQVGQTKTKLDALKSAEKQVQEQFERGDVSKQKYEALQREIAETERSLKKLNDAADNSHVALEKIAGTAKKVGDAAQTVATKTKGISAVAAGAVAGLGAMAVKAGIAADDLNTLAKQSGFGTDEIQKWQYAADRIDVASDDIVKSAQKMKKNMVSTSKETLAAWDELGVSVTDSNGELRDSTEVFYEVLEALSQVENETQRDVLAMQLFGKSADSLAGIVDDGGAALRELGAEAEAAGLILSQDALDGANAFNDGIDKLKAQAAAAFGAVGSELAESLVPAMENLVVVISDVLTWIAQLDGSQLKLIATMLLVVSAISPVAGAISAVSGAVSSVSMALPAFKAGLTAVSSGISAVGKGVLSFLSNPIVLLIAAIVALVALIATKGDEIKAALQKVDDFLQNIFAKDWTEIFGPLLGNALNAFFANIKNIWDAIKQIFDGIIDFIRGVFTGDWERAWDGVKSIFKGIFDGLEAIVKAPLNGIIGLVNAAISGINLLIRGINKVPGVTIGEIEPIPYLAKGGIVHQGAAIVGEAGPELLTVNNGRTMVQPLTNYTTNNHTSNLGGLTINVYGASGQDVNDLADQVAERIEDMAARKGAVFA